MIIEFETTKKVIITFNLDESETSEFLHWQLQEDGPGQKDILKYLEQRDLPRKEIHFPLEIDNMISVDDDDE